MVERRTNERRPAYWAGQLRFNQRKSVLDCLVRNASGSGVKLVLTGATFVPRDFELLIPKNHAEYRAKVVWRQSDEIGVRLESTRPGSATGRTTIRRQGKFPSQQQMSFRAVGESTPMALIRWLKKLRQQHAAQRRRLLAQCG